LLGVVFLVYGVITVIWPQAGVVSHFTNNARGGSPRYQQEVVTKTGSRVYGGLAILMGSGIVFASFHGKKK